jgi:hypothetical protein
MRVATTLLTALAAGAALVTVTALPASAACTRLAFSVNDYGKEGPTRDAKELLDKYIAKKMAEKGVTKYTTGKKDVTCELFLNLILFDEHTCKAEATVCWDGSALPKSEQVTAEGNDGKQTTGSIEKPAAKAAEKTKAKADDASVAAAKSEKPAKETTKPSSDSAAAKTIEAAPDAASAPAEVAPVQADEAPAAAP